MTTTNEKAGMTRDPIVPRIARLRSRQREVPGVTTLSFELEDSETGAVHGEPGQFNMLTAFGVGEAAISISGKIVPGRFVHTVRDVGAVSHALSELRKGDAIGLRGPFGTGWPITENKGRDIVVVAGGVGLAPLRPALYRLLAQRRDFGRIVILCGARHPRDVLFLRELEKWQRNGVAEVEITVDHTTEDWHGHVGVVTKLIANAGLDPAHSTAFICGPEIMMRFAVKALIQAGLGEDALYLSMERNMKCAVGFCGHCQFGPTFICRDGPVFRYDRISKLLWIKEL